MPNLIIGGTSGLGLEIAREMAERNEKVIVTGRHDPQVDFAEYREFDLAAGDLARRVGEFVSALPNIRSLVYSAGFFQEGHITDLSDEDIDKMIDVGARGKFFFVKKLLEKQHRLDEFIDITSTSAWVPREYEQIYNFVKAGSKLYCEAQSKDQRIGHTIEVGPSGMDTEFWDGTDKDTSNMMDPKWVAKETMKLRAHPKWFTSAKILGQTTLPQRVEIQ